MSETAPTKPSKVQQEATFRRWLRRESTEAERILWQLIRDRQIAGAKFRRQYQHGRYVLDFFCVERRLAIEVDGSQHYTPEGIDRDLRRTAYLTNCGVRVLRFTNVEVLREEGA